MRAGITETDIREAMSVNETCAQMKCPNRADDLVSAGNLGIAQALENYNPAKGMKFSSYANFYIKRNQRRELTNICKGVYIPSGISDYPELRDTVGEVFWLDDATGSSNPEINELSILETPANLFRAGRENPRLAVLEEGLFKLTKKERALLELYYIDGYSMRTIAKRLKKQRWIIEQSIGRALERLRLLMGVNISREGISRR